MKRGLSIFIILALLTLYVPVSEACYYENEKDYRNRSNTMSIGYGGKVFYDVKRYANTYREKSRGDSFTQRFINRFFIKRNDNKTRKQRKKRGVKITIKRRRGYCSNETVTVVTNTEKGTVTATNTVETKEEVKKDITPVINNDPDLVITEYNVPEFTGRPLLAKRAVKPGVGTVWDYYNDGTYNVYYNYESGDYEGKMEKIINTTQGTVNEYYYQITDEVGVCNAVIMTSWIGETYVTTYNEYGKTGAMIWENKVNRAIYDDTQSLTGWEKNATPTNEEKETFAFYTK